MLYLPSGCLDRDRLNVLRFFSQQRKFIRPAAFPVQAHFSKWFFSTLPLAPTLGTLICHNPLKRAPGGSLAHRCVPVTFQIQMLCGMFDIDYERDNAGCQVGKSPKYKAKAIRKTWSSARHDFNKIPSAQLLNALVQGKLKKKSREQLRKKNHCVNVSMWKFFFSFCLFQPSS